MFHGRLVLTLAGVVFSIGLLVSLSLHADPLSRPEVLTPAESRGKIIYTMGQSPSGGPLFYRLVTGGQRLLARGVTCATCHGLDGKGGREGDLVAPDITYQALIKPRHVTLPSGRKRVPYTDVLLARAITEGLDSSNNRLNSMMPRWFLSDSELQDLLRYLKHLASE
jgi:mono/diheme cytochrome c family protein